MKKQNPKKQNPKKQNPKKQNPKTVRAHSGKDEVVLATRDEIKKLKTKVRRKVSKSTTSEKSKVVQAIEAREIQMKIARLELQLSDVEKLESGAKKKNRSQRLRGEVAATRRAVDAK